MRKSFFGTKKGLNYARFTKKAKTMTKEYNLQKTAELSRKGWSQSQIAEELEVTPNTVYNYQKELLEEWKENRIENMDGYVMLELAVLGEMQQAIYDKAINGNMSAFDRMMKILERRAKYLSLDGATKHRIDINNLNALSDEELEQILNGDE